MPSFEPIDFDPHAPLRPTTPPVRRGFLLTLALLCLAASLVYGIPFILDRAGYAWEAGRSRAAIEALDKLEKAGKINDASVLFRMAATAVSPAVVNIHTETEFRGPNGQVQALGIGLGSGVVIDKDKGYIVTNHHVIKDAIKIEVRLGRGQAIPARVVGADPQTDLAVIQVRGGLPVAARWADSDKVAMGDWVLAIGSPFALDQTVTAGIVSATGRNNLRIIGEGGYEDFIQTDAAINPGNSGGPLIDLAGRVVGINTAIYSPPVNGNGNGRGERRGSPHGEVGFNTGIGFAISSNMARRVVEQLVKEGRVIRGYLGVRIQDFSALAPAHAEALKVREGQGAVVSDVEPDSPAARSGLKNDDVIVEIGGREVVGAAGLRNIISSLGVGTRVPVRYYRDGKPRRGEVTIGEMPTLVALGLRLRDLPPHLLRRLPDEPGSAVVVEQVAPGSPAEEKGLAPGMRVLGVGDQPVRSKAECEHAVARLIPGKAVPLRVRGADGRDYTIRLGGDGQQP
ncbi:MAG TPA: trypsin-like peptidase domain-containing protein [Isosphaeraceae bacterium]|nr:trypsin-like peptidase domain-containing protein [Isosphaeraceae bacterium]